MAKYEIDITPLRENENIEENSIHLGQHLFGEFSENENSKYLEKVEDFSILIPEISKHVNVINYLWHQFEPQGYTCLILLAESHISIHTQPEYNIASFDIYTCSENNEAIIKVYSLMKKHFKPKREKKKLVKRGF